MSKRPSLAQSSSVPDPSATTPPAAPHFQAPAFPNLTLPDQINRDKLEAEQTLRRGAACCARQSPGGPPPLHLPHNSTPPFRRRGAACRARLSESSPKPPAPSIQPLIATPSKLETDVTPTKQRTATRPNRHNSTHQKRVLLRTRRSSDGTK